MFKTAATISTTKGFASGPVNSKHKTRTGHDLKDYGLTVPRTFPHFPEHKDKMNVRNKKAHAILYALGRKLISTVSYLLTFAYIN